ncbi:NB-ARC domain-containing protein [Actinomadura sp. NPDC049753]|uniref:NB-ARC domain-containing protein n=1 Tax=Actinomadura sp. NPDC049753 TaxID=3154739 RepID=UPI0034225DD1
MAVRGVRRRWAAAVGGSLVIVLAVAWTVGWSDGDLDERLERASWVTGGLIAAAVVVAGLARWAWLWQTGRQERSLVEAEGFLGAAPRAEPRFVPRTDLTTQAVRALRHGRRAVAFVGLGGAGKSTLATAVCRDRRLRRKYKQATWIKTEPGADPVALLTDLARRLGITDPSYATVEHARDALAKELAGRRLLIVLDNVWTRGPLDAVLGLSPGCPVLFTTRSQDLATTIAALPVPVDEMTQDQALAVLANWTGQPVDELPTAARKLCTRLRNLALGVAMAGAMAARGRSFENVLALIEDDLRKVKGDFDPEYEYPTLRAAIDVGIDILPQDQRDQYLRLAVFTGRGPFPREAAAALWHPFPGPEVDELLETLVGHSLLTTAGNGRYIAHDLQCDAITQRLGPDRVRDAHAALLDGYQARRPGPWVEIAVQDPYLPGNLAWHLHRAGRENELDDLLSEVSWMHTRITTASLPDLLGDYTHATGLRGQAIRRALMQSVLALTEQAEGDVLAGQLAGQLAGRLMAHPDDAIATWAAALTPHLRTAWLRPLTPAALNPITDPLELIIAGPAGSVTALAFSPDGTRIVTGSSIGTTHVWDAHSGRELSTFSDGYHDSVNALAFSPDGALILVGGPGRTARIWNARNGQGLTTFTGHTDWVAAATFSPDGTRVLTGSWDGTARIWDASTGRKITTLAGHTHAVGAVAFTPNGTRVLTGSWDGTARIWDANTGREISTLIGRSWVTAVAFSSDRTRALTIGIDGKIRVWDASTGQEVTTLTGPANGVTAATFSPDRTRILVCYDDGEARVWDANTGQNITTLIGHAAEVTAVALGPGGSRALTGSQDGTVRIWTVDANRHSTRTIDNTDSVEAIAISPDGTRTLTGDRDGTVRIWDAGSGREVITLNKHDSSVKMVGFSPNGTRVVSIGWDSVRISDATSGRELSTLTSFYGEVSAAAFSQDGTRILTSGAGGLAQIWDTNTGQCLARAEDHDKDPVTAIAFTPDGSRFLTGGLKDPAQVWDSSTGRVITILTHLLWVHSVEFSPDGTRILTCDGITAQIRDAQAGREIVILRHTDQVTASTFSPDGTRALTVGRDGVIVVWDADSGHEMCRWSSDRPIRDCRFRAGTSDEILVAGDGPKVTILRLEGVRDASRLDNDQESSD